MTRLERQVGAQSTPRVPESLTLVTAGCRAGAAYPGSDRSDCYGTESVHGGVLGAGPRGVAGRAGEAIRVHSVCVPAHVSDHRESSQH